MNLLIMRRVTDMQTKCLTVPAPLAKTLVVKARYRGGEVMPSTQAMQIEISSRRRRNKPYLRLWKLCAMSLPCGRK